MPRYKYIPGGMLLQWVVILMVVNVVVLLVASVSTLMEINLIGQLMDGQDVPAEQLDGNDQRQGLIGFLEIGIYLVLAILFLRSLSRANRNARALGADDMEFTPGWCIGWFFVPIMNLFKPYRAVQEMWRASTPSTGRWQDNSTSSLVGVWWGMWIICAIAGQASFRLSLHAEAIGEILTSSYVSLVASLVEIPLSIVALLMLRNLYELQSTKQRLVHERKNATMIGEILPSSCPACGEPLSSSVSNCPMCGHQSGHSAQIDDTYGDW